MPPKPKFTRERIIDTGFELVREKGWAALSTRAIANRLGSSPIPIYSCFSSINDLEPEILDRILCSQQRCMNRRFTEDPWHDHGIGYVLFATEERQLFLGINDAAHFTAARHKGQKIWDDCNQALKDYPPFRGLSYIQIRDVQLKRWMLAHGLAFHACFAPCLETETIIAHIREGSRAILEGLKLQYPIP